MNSITFANRIFEGSPKPPCTFKINFKTPSERNKVLWIILVAGAKKLYGNELRIESIEAHQFHSLDKYIQSLGYKIRYQSITQGTLVWFEKIKMTTLCNGIKLIGF
jgi:hypothetical protein